MIHPVPASPSMSPTRTRIPALDVLRGVAVAGILAANVLIFFGLFVMPPDRAAALSTVAGDDVVLLLEKVFVDGKFYSVFSLLFGVGFGLQLARGGEAALPRFRRRLRILLVIGAIHAFVIWAGDILMLYALLGFTMPWFARKSDRELLRWTAIMMAIPTVLYLVALAAWAAFGPAGRPSPQSAGAPAAILDIFARMGTGGVKDAVIGNLVFVAARWADLVASVRFPKVLGMFVLGLWCVRSGVAVAPHEHRATLVRWCRLGWGFGVPANVVAAYALHAWPYLPPSPGGLLGVVGQAIGVPLLALGYAATIGLLVVDGRRAISILAPLGRMALTNYLTHSIVCVVLSRGFGFAMWWRVGASTAMAIAGAIIAVQIPVSAWWLSRYRFGPVEWIWRRLTYQAPLAMRRAPALAIEANGDTGA